ncbi:MAG TPA: tetratricopeptide repeat protein, partial [Novosphingobium sp.]
MKRSLLLAPLLPALLALAACGDDPATLLARARAELAAGDDKAARIDLIAALKARPDDAILLDLLAHTQLRLGDGDGALATLDRLTKLGAKGPAMARLRAEAELRRGNAGAALALLAGDTDPDAWRIRAAAHRAQGDDAATLNDYAAGIKAGGSKDLAIDYARFLMDGQDLAGAEIMLARAHAIGGDAFDVEMLAGDLHARQGRIAEALAAYRSAATRAPRRIEPLLGQAELADAAGQAGEVERLVGLAGGIAPDDPRVGRWKIQLAQMKGDWETVRAALGPRESSIEPASADGFAYAEALLRLGQPEQARAMFSRAVSVSPQNPYARLMLAEAQLATGDARTAFETVRPLAEASDATDRALDLAERAARAASLPEAAAISARRTSPLAAENRRLSAQGLTAFARGNWAAATSAYAALTARGDNPEALRMYALSASQAGQHDAAVAAADRALALRPDNPDMLYTAGGTRVHARRDS